MMQGPIETVARIIAKQIHGLDTTEPNDRQLDKAVELMEALERNGWRIEEMSAPTCGCPCHDLGGNCGCCP